MEPQSPPKRMTRARAAAAASKPTRTMSAASTTAASRAKAAASAATKTTAKRKTRADENDDGEDEVASAPAMKTARPRGRPRKAEEPAEEPKPVRRAATAAAGTAARATRATRAKKIEPAEEEPAKPKRGRPRKNTENEEPKTAPEPVKTRTRAATTTATKPVAKKTVTFQEPEKENINPDTKKEGEAKPAAGIRGRPVRRGAAAAAPKTTTTTTAAPAAKTTRGARATTTKPAGKAPEKMPLSPKKATQVTARDRDPPSEDELAGPEKTPLKKKPLRPPPSSTLVQSKASEAAEEAPAEKADEPKKEEEEAAPADVLRSPAKRPPPTPFKDAIKSPAKRAEGFQLPASASKPAGQQPGATPLKMSLLQSPAKKPQAGLSMAPPALPRAEPVGGTPLRSSLMGTPARRPGSVLRAFASARKEAAAAAAVEESPATRATILSTPLTAAKPSEMLMDGEEAEGAAGAARNLFAEPMPSLKFPGRLSAVLPRDADPAYDLDMTTVEEGSEDAVQLVGDAQEAEVEEPAEEGEPLGAEDVHKDAEVDEETDVEVSDKEPVGSEDDDHEMSDIFDEAEQAADENNTEQPEEPSNATRSTPKPANEFSLRQEDLDPFKGLDEESDDEQTSTPQRNKSTSPTRSVVTPSGLPRRVSTGRRASGLGFTPLADKLGAWKASSPVKAAAARRQSDAASVMSNDDLARQCFFDDEMSVREQNEINAEIMAALEADIDAQIDPGFDDIPFTAEDMELAEEAEELSMMESEPAAQDPDETLSEASQDYGDENQVPSEPSVAVPPQTPARPIQNSSHTVSKVPLKGADHSTPSPVKRRRHSVSKLPVQRPASVRRSATVISYSPTKSDRPAAGTPSKEAWSAQGTPARTPRKDLQAGLLRGAVVYVDVRTSDGGDASEFFVELLGEMGARCVRRWDWGPAEDSARVGITHVVYKDGGKRTLEKVREAGGVVQCVGASWVLE